MGKNNFEKPFVFRIIKEEVIPKKSAWEFTLSELMVVILIIGILLTLALPRILDVSAKSKAADAPSIIGNWESSQTAYVHENSKGSENVSVGFVDPTPNSRWFKYLYGCTNLDSRTIPAEEKIGFGICNFQNNYISPHNVTSFTASHSSPVETYASTHSLNF